MHLHKHPNSGAIASGIILEPGIVLKATDLYDSTTGKWDTCPHLAGSKVRPKCDTVWVRPVDTLSMQACLVLSVLLCWKDAHLVFHEDIWKVLPSLHLADDRRMYWRMEDDTRAQEIVDAGLVVPIDGDELVYKLTGAGRKVAQMVSNKQ
jgi:hypothetical protein